MSAYTLKNREAMLSATLFAVAYVKKSEPLNQALQAISSYIHANNELAQAFLGFTDLGASQAWPDLNLIGFQFTVASEAGVFVQTSAQRIATMLNKGSNYTSNHTRDEKALKHIAARMDENVTDWAFSITDMHPTESPLQPLVPVTSYMSSYSYTELQPKPTGGSLAETRAEAHVKRLAGVYRKDVMHGLGPKQTKLTPWTDPTCGGSYEVIAL